MAGVLAGSEGRAMAQQAPAGARYLVELEALPTAAQVAAVPARQRLDALMEQLRVPPAARLCWLRTGWEMAVLAGADTGGDAGVRRPALGGQGAAGSARGHRPGPRLPRLPPERDGPQ